MDKKGRIVDKFLENIEKYRFAILGTVIVHVMIIVGSSFTEVQKVGRMPSQSVEIEIPLEDVELEDILPKDIKKLDESNSNENLSNLVADENDQREKSYENYATNKAESEEEIRKNVEELERQFFKEAAANNPNKNVFQDNSHTAIETKADKFKMPNEGTEKNAGSNKSFAGKVMISYNLSGRKSYSLPNPGYTCNSSGTIVVEIKVGSDGTVKSTSYLSSQSTSSSDCLIKRALRYASRSRFDSGSSSNQTGTITYKFVSQ